MQKKLERQWIRLSSLQSRLSKRIRSLTKTRYFANTSSVFLMIVLFASAISTLNKKITVAAQVKTRDPSIARRPAFAVVSNHEMNPDTHITMDLYDRFCSVHDYNDDNRVKLVTMTDGHI
ncbi:hypothetical protein GN244_ATG05565 [Phytophthora infestans]|nr:hypothetical protein GN244_ATG05565 [Phytophthora infestans]